jgi:phosphonoacetate hydrolase
LQEVLDEWLGRARARVILPITDPYVVHHGALGSYATVYLPPGFELAPLMAHLGELDGIDRVLGKSDACAQFELPEDRVGDIVIVSRQDVVLGTRRERHDLSGLTVPLRSHGGLSEQEVPLIFNRRLKAPLPAGRLRNFDVFSIALNQLEPR